MANANVQSTAPQPSGPPATTQTFPASSASPASIASPEQANEAERPRSVESQDINISRGESSRHGDVSTSRDMQSVAI